MMGHIMTYISDYHSVGKTTLTFHTVWRLHEKGYRILVIDFDGQGVTFSSMCGLDTGRLKEKVKEKQSLYHVFTGDCKVQDAIISVTERLDVLSFGMNLSYMQPMTSIEQFQQMINEIKDQYDYIFIDVNSSPDWRYALTLSVADDAIIPMDCSKQANVSDCMGILNLIDSIREQFYSQVQILGFVANFVDDNELQSYENFKRRMAMYRYTVFDTYIPVSDVIHAFTDGDVTIKQKQSVYDLFDKLISQLAIIK